MEYGFVSDEMMGEGQDEDNRDGDSRPLSLDVQGTRARIVFSCFTILRCEILASILSSMTYL